MAALEEEAFFKWYLDCWILLRWRLERSGGAAAATKPQHGATELTEPRGSVSQSSWQPRVPRKNLRPTRKGQLTRSLKERCFVPFFSPSAAFSQRYHFRRNLGTNEKWKSPRLSVAKASKVHPAAFVWMKKPPKNVLTIPQKIDEFDL